MAAIGTLPVVLGTGIHASRPAASAVGKGGLYSCTTHSLVYQTDGSSWTTWANLAGTGGAGTITTVEEVDASPTDSAVTKIVFPNGTLGITSHVATYTPAAASLTSATADSTGDVTLSADTIADATGVSVTLAAGTWFLIAQVTISAASGTPYALGQITDSSNVVLGEARNPQNSAAGPTCCVPMAVVTPGSSTTYKVRGQSGGGGTIKILRYGQGTNIGTRIIAIKLA